MERTNFQRPQSRVKNSTHKEDQHKLQTQEKIKNLKTFRQQNGVKKKRKIFKQSILV